MSQNISTLFGNEEYSRLPTPADAELKFKNHAARAQDNEASCAPNPCACLLAELPVIVFAPNRPDLEYFGLPTVHTVTRVPTTLKSPTKYLHICPNVAYTNPNHPPMAKHLSKRVANHDHHSWPEEPITGAGDISRLIHARKGQKGHHVPPFLVAWVRSLSLASSIVDCKRPDDTPSEKRAKKIGDADI